MVKGDPDGETALSVGRIEVSPCCHDQLLLTSYASQFHLHSDGAET